MDSSKQLSQCINASPHLKSLRNILMTFTMHNFDLGYVQGMNELCSPLFETIVDEAVTFWSFIGFMERMVININSF